ncbi:MAG TPA: hypothetical protein VL020_04945 [Pseudomonadales bacterium]|nr:hypothetical protein [Pseudomonadales bacterium]
MTNPYNEGGRVNDSSVGSGLENSTFDPRSDTFASDTDVTTKNNSNSLEFESIKNNKLDQLLHRIKNADTDYDAKQFIKHYGIQERIDELENISPTWRPVWLNNRITTLKNKQETK